MNMHALTTDGLALPWLDACTRSELTLLAELWGVALRGQDLAAELAAAMLTPNAVAHVLAGLNAPQRAALELVQSHGGVLAAHVLEREFGELRPTEGYASPRAYLLNLRQPPSPVEQLFILGLLLVDDGPRRYRVPAALLPLLPPVLAYAARLQLAASEQPSLIEPAEDELLERRIVTLLALAQTGGLSVGADLALDNGSVTRLARRWGDAPGWGRVRLSEARWPYLRFLRAVLETGGLVRLNGAGALRPTRAAVGWLRAPRGERFAALLAAWVQTPWDELTALLGFGLRHAAARRPELGRQAVLELLGAAPLGQWVNWESLRAEVRRARPDFARPDGNYHSWGLSDRFGRAADGFARWNDVEGALLEATVGVSLRWLGLVDAGAAPAPLRGEPALPQSFRLTPLGAALLGVAAHAPERAPAPLAVDERLIISVPPEASLHDRFQVARVAEFVGGGAARGEQYRLTAPSIAGAAEQGIDGEEIVAFFERVCAGPLPLRFVESLRSTAERTARLRFRRGIVLHAEAAGGLAQLRRDRRLRLPPAEPLGDEALLLREGDGAPLAAELRRLGYALSGAVEQDGPLSERDLTSLAAALALYRGVCARVDREADPGAALAARLDELLNERQRAVATRLAAQTLARLDERLGE